MLKANPEPPVCADCVIPAGQSLVQNEDGSSTLMCVKCPFCKQIVNAHMTKTTISCPECKALVQF